MEEERTPMETTSSLIILFLVSSKAQLNVSYFRSFILLVIYHNITFKQDDAPARLGY